MEPVRTLEYNPLSEVSILAHAIKLLGKSIHDLYPNATGKEGKGNIGNSVEYYHFGYKPNSNPEPDFEEVNRELKVTPLDKTGNGYTAGERLVVGMVDFIKDAEATCIEESHFWQKARMLLMFYLRKKGSPYLDFVFQMIRYWEIPESDLRIIIEDWNKIHDKLVNGLAHEMHEGDTMYLGTCKKGGKDTKCRAQFKEGAPLAFPRAFCLKQSYMSWIVVDTFLGNFHKSSSMNIDAKYINKVKRVQEECGRVLSNTEQGQTFDEFVIQRFNPYIGKTLEEICILTNTEINYGAKDYGYAASKAILGVKKKRIEEFEKADIQLKTIRLNTGCTGIEQHMSFPAIDWIKLSNEQEWTESEWYNTITKRFFFVVFERDSCDNHTKASKLIPLELKRQKMRLKGVFFWSIDNETESQCELVWKDTRDKVRSGDYNSFIGMATNSTCHIRPHDNLALYNTPTPQGYLEKKKCFWLNNNFIYKLVKENIELSI